MGEIVQDNKMKIAVYMEFSGNGGPDVSLITIIKSWLNKDDAFVIFCNNTHPGLPRIKRVLNGMATFVDLAMPIYIGLYIKIETWDYSKYVELVLKRFLYLLRYPLLFFQVLFLYNKFIRCRPDFVLINNGSYPGAESCCAAAIAAKLLGIKKIMMIRGEPIKIKSKLLRPIERIYDYFIDRSVDRFVAVSEAVRNAMTLNRFLSPQKITVIYNSVFASQENRRKNISDNFEIGIIAANFKAIKGHLVLFEAIRLVTNKGIPARLYVAGSGSPRDEAALRGWVKRKDMGECIQFLGYLNNVADFMKKLDVVIVPSIHYEPCPLVLLEAMASGVPLIASRIGGIPEIIEDGVNGMLVEPEDKEALAMAIERFYKNRGMREKMALMARLSYKSKFTPDRMALEYYNTVKEVLASG